MVIVPLAHEPKCLPRKPTLEDSAGEAELDRVGAEVGMEVRRRIISVEHPDHDPREAAQFGHGLLPVRHAAGLTVPSVGYTKSAFSRRRTASRALSRQRPTEGDSDRSHEAGLSDESPDQMTL